MNEIKFRAWNKVFSKMITHIRMIDFVYKKIQYDTDSTLDCTKRFGDIELMQYTGIKDKDGTEIYDGDIVRCFSHSLSKVEFKKGCFGLTSDGLHEPYFAPFSDIYGYCEILGNIYENPELLEAMK